MSHTNFMVSRFDLGFYYSLNDKSNVLRKRLDLSISFFGYSSPATYRGVILIVSSLTHRTSLFFFIVALRSFSSLPLSHHGYYYYE